MRTIGTAVPGLIVALVIGGLVGYSLKNQGSDAQQLKAFQIAIANTEKALGTRIENLKRVVDSVPLVEHATDGLRQSIEDLEDAKENRTALINATLRIAKKKHDEGNNEEVELYLLNAASRFPESFECLRELHSFTLNDNKEDVDSLNRLESILQEALYRVRPDDVAKVLGLLEVLTAERDRMAIAEWTKRTKDAIAALGRSTGRSSSEADALKIVADSLTELRNLVDGAPIGKPMSDDAQRVLQSAQQELHENEAAQAVLGPSIHIEVCIRNLNKLRSDPALFMTASRHGILAFGCFGLAAVG